MASPDSVRSQVKPRYVSHGRETGFRMDLLVRTLELVFGLRGKPIPVGQHLAIDLAFSALDWAARPVKLKVTLYSADDMPLGSYLALADASTETRIDGQGATLDEVLGAIGEQHDHLRLIVEEPGWPASIDLLVRESSRAGGRLT